VVRRAFPIRMFPDVGSSCWCRRFCNYRSIPFRHGDLRVSSELVVLSIELELSNTIPYGTEASAAG